MYINFFIFKLKYKRATNSKSFTSIKKENISSPFSINTWKLTEYNINPQLLTLPAKMALLKEKIALFSMPQDVCFMKPSYLNTIGYKRSCAQSICKIGVQHKRFLVTLLVLKCGIK